MWQQLMEIKSYVNILSPEIRLLSIEPSMVQSRPILLGDPQTAYHYESCILKDLTVELLNTDHEFYFRINYANKLISLSLCLSI